MTNQIISHLRTYRERGGLTQAELARLVGWRSQATVSRYEQTGAIPPIRVALALQFLFGASLGRLFPHAVDETEDQTVQRVARFSAKDRQPSARKERLFAGIARRARSSDAGV